ncbi:MAG TPA: cobyric acid synthase [Lachnospiraceae bacterium]|nr:cobyric acid synthase [Lachnospiraceae bacterium]
MAKSIMIQGTMSNVGKSILVGGLCRVFKQDGYRVAPFKSQNMALNSYITKEGLEMGRAQVMQAEAAKIEPSVLMNPILLKPTNDTGSQVIINGEVQGTMTAWEYYRNKRSYIPVIEEAYHRLEEQYDIIVIEGAGSPAEINLKEDDIVNMGMARIAKSPVLLVGDINLGGVFAQLVGTIQLLEEDEQAMVKGMIINKFRGDKAILEPGLKMLEDRVNIPIHGVLPYLHLDIDDEDSLSERFTRKDTVGLVDIAVIRLPRISNFTDFNPFECMEEISLRYVSTPNELKDPDMIILPGTKNTMEDLLWLRQTGLEAKILQQAARGKIIFGICGGYQMLGRELYDPNGIEHKGVLHGLGLLPIKTVFQATKTRTRVCGTFQEVSGILKGLTGTCFEGYEIHMGHTTILDIRDVSSRESYEFSQTSEKPGNLVGMEVNIFTHIRDEITDRVTIEDGVTCGNIYGTYVHGIFDHQEVVKVVTSAIMTWKGYDGTSVQSFSRKEYKEKQYDLLADAIRENLDMERIYQIIEEGL